MVDGSISSTDEARRINWSRLDAVKAELEAQFTGWRIWFVPRSTDGGANWCAQPLPNITCYSPEDLKKAIQEAEANVPLLKQIIG